MHQPIRTDHCTGITSHDHILCPNHMIYSWLPLQMDQMDIHMPLEMYPHEHKDIFPQSHDYFFWGGVDLEFTIHAYLKKVLNKTEYFRDENG